MLIVALAAVPAAAQEVKHEFGGTGFFDQTGLAVGGGTDVDGNGVPDVVVSSPGAGRIDVLSGVDYSVVRTILLPAGIESMGYAADGAGDVDGDGFGDVITSAVATPGHQPTVLVVSGGTGAPLFSFTGHTELGGYGESVSEAGDVDGDGHADLLIGAWTHLSADKGEVELRSGKTGAILYQWAGLSTGETLGTGISEAGDVDGDGYLDLAAGGAGFSTSLPHGGIAEVYSGKDGSRIHRWFGAVNKQRFGFSVSGGGDVDGDGFDDVAVGAPGDGLLTGEVTCFSGASGAPFLTRAGGPFAKDYGWSVAIVGDLDGDGHADIGVGDPPTFAAPGVQVLSGADGSVITNFYNDIGSERVGESIDGVGDLDGDGLPEFVFGASRDSFGGVAVAGTASVVGLCPRYLPFGESCAGSGIVPKLLVTGCPGPGGAGALEIQDALGGATAFLLFGTGPGSTPVGGCELLLSGLSPVVAALPLGGAQQGQGEVSVPFVLPAVVPPASLTVQALIVKGSILHSTNGLEVSLP